jgi:hypothetical protein
MKGFRIPHFEYRICRGVLLALAVHSLCAPAQAAAGRPTPTPTPTPRKLAGGFGRAPETEAPLESTPAAQQPLGDAVRASREKARKEQKATVAITNRNLVTDPKKGKLTTASPSKTPARPAPTPASPESVGSPEPAAPEQGEVYWRRTLRTARERAARLKELVEELAAASKRLENDFYTWDDGQYRDGVIKPAWDKKREELEAARRELEDADRDLAELPERARKAGALPGWLREQ